MPILEKGQQAPHFTLINQDEQAITLRDFQGKWVVLYFYPKDNTSGCTLEAKDFTCLAEQFAELNAVIVGISPDSISSHQKFIAKQELNLNLLSDPDKTALQAYGAWRMKKNYGREYMGVVRSTFLIDPEGVVRQVWDNVRVKGHAEKVLSTLTKIANK